MKCAKRSCFWLLPFFYLSFCVNEAILRAVTASAFWRSGLAVAWIFALVPALALGVLCRVFPPKLNRVLELPGEADVVTADVDLTTVKHAGRPLFTAPVNVTAKAVNRAGVVTLDCTYRFTLHVLCDRCLAPLELPVDRTVSHTVVREVNGEDDETFLVAENGCVELEELATNDILPELPQRYLCREDCRGLCPTCGKNLNEGPCGCREDSGDPRMDVLRRLLEN